MEKEYISRKGHEELYQEYLEIDKQIHDTMKKMGESAKRDNDLRENPEYIELRVQAMYTLPKQKQNILTRYQNAIIIEETEEYKNFDGNTVIMGTKVKLMIDGEEEEYKILGNKEGNLNLSILSCEAPIVKALIQKHLKETVEFNGMEISILSIEKI